MNKQYIAPSILACDFGRLNEEVDMVNSSEADWLHVDIMDGRFVPNMSFGFPVFRAMAKRSEKPLDVHLMIVEPEKYVEQFAKDGAAVITVHAEACNHLHRTVHQIKELGCKAGVALNPHTSIACLEHVLIDVDLVCIMSVNPGYGGQKFIQSTYSKVIALKEMIMQKRAQTLIEIDGGVSLSNANELVNAGANVLVAGSAVFKAENPINTISQLKKGINNTLLA